MEITLIHGEDPWSFQTVAPMMFPFYGHRTSVVGYAEPALSLIGATSTVRVIHLSSQNCIQADIQSAKPLPHMNLNVSERLIWALRGMSRFTDRLTG